MPFSRRSTHDLTPNALARVRAARGARGAEVLDLTTSLPGRVGLGPAPRALLAALEHPGVVDYHPQPFGLPAARMAAAASWSAHGVTIDPDRVLLTASTSEAYAFLFKLLCDPGDTVLAPTPSYPLLDHLAAYEGVRLLRYPLAYDGAWHVDRAQLRRQAAQGASAVVIVSPNNPTGSYLRRDDLEAIAELGLPIISDEVFGAYPLARPTATVRSALEATGSLVFALGGLSKLAALPQLKLAWIAVGGPEREARDALGHLELIADAFLGVGTPVQLSLARLLALGDTTRQAIRARTRRNLTTLERVLDGSVLSALHVEGGWYAPVRTPAELVDGEWPLALLEQTGVLVQPGWLYDLHEPPSVVVSLLTEPALLERALGLLVDHAERTLGGG